MQQTPPRLSSGYQTTAASISAKPHKSYWPREIIDVKEFLFQTLAVRDSVAPGLQVRPAARRLTEARREEARTLYECAAEGNAVVVQRLLQERGVTVSVRTIERAVADIRRARRNAELATVRVESAPGDQLQIDLGQKRVEIGNRVVRVFFLVAVLSYSRRLFVTSIRADPSRRRNQTCGLIKSAADGALRPSQH